MHEAVGLARLLPECLHDTESAERFLHDRERRALELFDMSRLAAHAGPYRRDSTNSGGDTPRATSASCQSRRKVTTIIMTSVTAAATNGMIPSTMIFSITAASCWMRYSESALPFES